MFPSFTRGSPGGGADPSVLSRPREMALALVAVAGSALCAGLLAGAGLLAPVPAALLATSLACAVLVLRCMTRVHGSVEPPKAGVQASEPQAGRLPLVPAQPQPDAGTAHDEALVRAVHNRDALISLASHDLRSALNAMVGWLYLARSPRADADALGRALDGIASAVDTQRRLVDALLDTMRVLDGRLTPRTHPLCTDGLLERIAVQSADPERQRGVGLEVLPASRVHWFDADPVHVDDALRVLVRHAIAVSPEHGTVRLQAIEGTGPHAGTVELRVECTRDAPGQAAGRLVATLPIAIARAVVEAQGGRLEVDTDAHRLLLRFPEADAGAATSQPTSASPQQDPAASEDSQATAAPPERQQRGDGRLAGCHVMLTDDREDMLEVTAAVLRRHGAQVTPARSGDETLKRYATWAGGGGERLLLSDLSMPGMDGLELIRRIRRLETERGLPRLPAVAISAQTDEWPRREVMLAGFDGVLAKPITPADMIASLLPLVGR